MSESPVTLPAHIQLGAKAEATAVEWLRGRGFRHVESNWRCSAGELDAVMWDEEELVFVEVKARTGASHGSAEESMTPAKARKIAVAAEWYLAEHSELGDPVWRIDLVAITLDRVGTIVRCTHIANAAQFD